MADFSFTNAYPHFDNHARQLMAVEKRQQKTERHLLRLEQKIQQVMTWRLGSGLTVLILGLSVASKPEWKILGIPFLVGLAIFIFLVRVNRRLQAHKRELQTYEEFLNRQILRLKGLAAHPLETPDPEIKIPYDKVMARDLYLTGQPSLFRLLDETFSEGGATELAHHIVSPVATVEAISDRQTVLRKLAPFHWPLIKLSLLGRLHGRQLRSGEVRNFLERPLTGERFWTLWRLHWMLFPAYIIATVLAVAGSTPFSPAWPIVLYAVFALYSLSEVAVTMGRSQDLQLSLSSLNPLFDHVERHERVFKSITPSVFEFYPSRRLKGLSLCLTGLSTQAHWLLHLVINALSPWSYFFAWLAERWKKKHAAAILQSQKELQSCEVWVSLVVLYHYQTQVFPQVGEATQLSSDQAYQPLIHRGQVVANSLTLNSEHRLALITGSNMSGKSTFLRTLGVNQQLAMMGAPVFARAFSTFCGPVLTCLQISDSLEIGYSTFYYEVRRVREILERAGRDERFVFLVDEIFRGTNNRERLIGSRAVIEHLLEHSQLIGLISTHDLELTQLGSTYKALQNWHFRDDVKNGQLHFSYRIHSGPCPTTNALRIMANEGLPVPLPK